ncbi:MAG: hypothetical protein M1820_007983 [Bogoriella megaspora]|nr:MAG: hypothetical protein M1820_007983 [Bogoriella megaspora]
MSDVRSMLRAERAARRIDHEDAHYTPGGMLMCKVCELPIKAETLWQKHTQSKAHRLQAQRKLDNVVPAPSNKKRKAGDNSDDEETERKKSKGDGVKNSGSAGIGTPDESLTPDVVTEDYTVAQPPVDQEINSAQDRTATVSGSEPVTTMKQNDGVDEDEWAAFERDIAAATPPPDPISALDAAAAISAAPMTADELAARAREEANEQRGNVDNEMEAEKEEAARRLDEEFEEMEGFEERVRRMKERREALRVAVVVEGDGEREGDGEVGLKEVVESEGESDEDEDEDEEDEWGGWHRKVG